MAADQGISEQEKSLQALILDDNLERLEDLLAEFNLFDVLGIWHRELQHSALLAWLLNPRGSHRLGDYFLRRFLSEAARGARDRSIGAITPFDVDGWTLSDVEVTRERYNIDVLAVSRADGFACLIENKVFSGESSGQLSRYLTTVEEEYGELRPFPVFLTPQGVEPREEADQARYTPLSYETVAELVEKVLDTRGSTISAGVAGFLEQYVSTLRRHVLDTTDNIQELAYQIYSNHREAIDLIIDAKASPPIDWGDIETAMKRFEPALQVESRTRRERRISTPFLDDISELNQGSGWSGSNRIVRFELKFTDRMTFHLWVGPGHQETRERLFTLAKERGEPFQAGGRLRGGWHSIYSKHVFGPTIDRGKVVSQVEQAVSEFYENDFRQLVNAIRAEFGLSSVASD